VIKQLDINAVYKVPTRVCALQASKDSSKVYMADRETYLVHEGKEIVIQDISNTEISIIDDRETLF
jgi:hypothetical protein